MKNTNPLTIKGQLDTNNLYHVNINNNFNISTGFICNMIIATS